MRKTLAQRLHLRAFKCPQCGASLPDVGMSPTVTCEYCDLVSEVVRAPQRQPPRAPPPRRNDWNRPRPQVTPHVRKGALGAIAAAILTLGGAGVSIVASTQTQMNASPPPKIAPHGKAAPSATPTGGDKARRQSHTDQITPKKAEAKKKKKKRRRKPKGYEIARIIKPAQKGCAPRDIMAPGHPLWYSPTITLTVKDGRFHKIRVKVKTSNQDLDKLWFSGDRTREVTQADVDERTSRVARCIKKKIAGIKIPAKSSQRRASGKVRFTLSRDGVPYGVKNL